MSKEIRAADTVDILARAYQLSQQQGGYPFGPYIANVDFRIAPTIQSLATVIRQGDIFSFDEADPVDIGRMIAASMISPYEGSIEVKDGW